MDRASSELARYVGEPGHKLEALEKLRESFDAFKTLNGKVPRPGTRVPLEFAESVRVDQHTELAKDFVHRVLEFECAWISDSSSLWDFHGEETNDRLNDKILEIYGVDVSAVPKAMLADIFDKISQQQKSNS